MYIIFLDFIHSFPAPPKPPAVADASASRAEEAQKKSYIVNFYFWKNTSMLLYRSVIQVA